MGDTAHRNLTELDGMRVDAHGNYIDGKLKRYNLLFAVNGGAFAIVQVLGECGRVPVGALQLGHLALGAMTFTGVMVFDIYAFATLMQDKYLPNEAFQRVGQVVLGLLGSLLVVGWYLVEPTRVAALVLAALIVAEVAAIGVHQRLLRRSSGAA